MGSSMGSCTPLTFRTGCALNLLNSRCKSLLATEPPWQEKQLRSSSVKFNRRARVPALWGAWQFSQPLAATVVPLVCGQGFSPAPFQVLVDTWCEALYQAGGLWQLRQRAEASFLWTRNFPN